MTPRQLDDPRHCRLPFYVVETECHAADLVRRPGETEHVLPERRRGCGVVISNTGRRAAVRNAFFHALTRRIEVRSGGRGFNNIGGPIPPGGAAKHEFLPLDRFNMCFENLSLPGYATEKLVEAMWARRIPIYWGDPLIAQQFNPASVLNVSDFENEERALEHVERIDRDDALYARMLAEPFFRGNVPNAFYNLQRQADFLRDAVESSAPPVSRRRRLSIGRWRIAKRMH